MNHVSFDYNGFIHSVDYSNPHDVVQKIKDFMDHKELADEQLLFGIGLLLNRNKEIYISNLKNENQILKGQAKSILDENNILRGKVNKLDSKKSENPLKKRVIVVKKGNENKVVVE